MLLRGKTKTHRQSEFANHAANPAVPDTVTGDVVGKFTHLGRRKTRNIHNKKETT
jgi:hypothetical protein